MKESVFISYSSKDSKIVEKIVAMLKEAGISYWKAPEMIPAEIGRASCRERV